MERYAKTILNKYGIENVETKLLEEIGEYLESGEDQELADILNVILTIDTHRHGQIAQIAYEKRNRTTIRMAADWYDKEGLRPCLNSRMRK